MDERPGSEADAVDWFLASRFAAAPDGLLRQALRRQTTRVLRRRRRGKQAALAAALALCYLAGLGTARLGAPPGPSETPARVERKAQPPDGKEGAPTSSAAAPGGMNESLLPLEQDPDVPAIVLERVAARFERLAAAAASEQRSDLYRRASHLYRRAGDRCLQDQHTAVALHCYARSLDTARDAGAEAELAVAAEDNWLLIALKRARLEEKDHVKTDS